MVTVQSANRTQIARMKNEEGKVSRVAGSVEWPFAMQMSSPGNKVVNFRAANFTQIRARLVDVSSQRQIEGSRCPSIRRDDMTNVIRKNEYKIALKKQIRAPGIADGITTNNVPTCYPNK